MGFTLEKQVCLLALLVLLFPLLCTSQKTLAPEQPIMVPLIAMGIQVELVGLDIIGRIVYDGNVAGVSRLYRNGAGCGACYQEDCKEWMPMRRAYGIVWDMANPPVGSICLRVLVCGSAGLSWVQTNNVIPDYWEPRAVYDSNIQLT